MDLFCKTNQNIRMKKNIFHKLKITKWSQNTTLKKYWVSLKIELEVIMLTLE